MLGLLREAIKVKTEDKLLFIFFLFYFDDFHQGKVRNVCVSWDSRRPEDVQEVEKTAL